MVCGLDDHAKLMSALEDCVATCVPTKVNVVAMKGVNDREIHDIIAHCERSGVAVVKLLDVIEDLDLGAESFSRRLKLTRGQQLSDLYMPVSEFLTAYHSEVRVDLSTNGELGHPLLRADLDSGMTLLAKDSRVGAWYSSECGSCAIFHVMMLSWRSA